VVERPLDQAVQSVNTSATSTNDVPDSIFDRSEDVVDEVQQVVAEEWIVLATRFAPLKLPSVLRELIGTGSAGC